MNQSQINDNFESKKNWKASGYTLLICILLAIVFLFVTWTLPSTPPPVIEDGIEVNLGNSDMGSGTDQPYLPGKPSQRDQEKYTPPKAAPVEKVATKEVETDDKQKEDAPVIKKPPVVKPNATKIPDKEVVKTKPAKVTEPIVNPTPAPPKPKAVFHGVDGTGKGGNDADNYKPGKGEGIAGGKGDQGRPGGDPDSKNYTGGGRGNSGVSISRGLQGRKIVAFPSFSDDFNENAKVAIDVHVDANGTLISAEYQPRGSTTSDASLKEIALRKVRQIKFNAGNNESFGTLVFNFQVKN